jgi:hypothetical protein
MCKPYVDWLMETSLISYILQRYLPKLSPNKNCYLIKIWILLECYYYALQLTGTYKINHYYLMVIIKLYF